MSTRCVVLAHVLTFALFLLLESTFVIAQKLPDVEVKMYNGKPTVFIDGKPNALAGYSPGSTRQFYDTYMPLFYKHKMGVYLIWMGHLSYDPWGSRFWHGDSISSSPVVQVPPDYFDLDQQVEHIMKGDPNAYIVIRFYSRGPESWSRLHPTEYCINDEGKVLDTPSLASDYFWNAASKFHAALVEYCESQPWANRVIGYNTHYLDEGCHMPAAEGWLFDHNPAMLLKWRDFLKNKYGSVDTLRAAYGDTTLTFETIEVPEDKLRKSVPEVSGILYWQSAKDNQPLRDYLELQRDLWHLRFRQSGAAMEGAAKRKVLILHDALKQTMLGWNHNGFFRYAWEKISWNLAFPEFMAGSGHMGVASLFENSPGFSGLLTPHDYQARGIGGVYEPEGIVDTAILRGKYFWAEMDTRSGTKDIGPARDVREWAGITWRNFANSFTRGYNSYWMYGFFIADWFPSDPVQEVIARQVDVINKSINWKHETVPGIAMILDDAAVLETNGSGNYFNESILWEQKMGIARCGVPFRIYLFEDLALDNFPKHRVYYFPNLFKADDIKLSLLRKKVFRDGNVVVWGPGSGISDGVTIGTASATRLTGFNFEMIPANAQRRILISNFDHPATEGLDAALIIGGPLSFGPVMLPTDGTELGVAWTKGGNNHIGLSVKEFGKGAKGTYKGSSPLGEGDYAAVFSTAVPLPASLWKNIARYACAHIYSETNDIIFADNSVVALHSLQSGKKRIMLPGVFRVHDLVNDKEYSSGTQEIVFDHRSPDTHVFLIGK